MVLTGTDSAVLCGILPVQKSDSLGVISDLPHPAGHE